MTVETGTLVKPGDLLVQLDTRDVQNAYNQSEADLKAAEAKLTVSEAQKKRTEELHNQRIITSQELEAAQIDYANSQASVVRARTNLDLAKQRLEDATVRAPVEGTVIEKLVSQGQVIMSGTSAMGGGTTLLKMADLDKVRVRALVNETDIGNIRPGMEANVTVDAFPDRPFRGTVEKIEPQAVIQQSVTMFPVLVSLSNLEGLLKPGMNGEVSVLIERRPDVLTVPNEAVRNVREAQTAATLLGLNPDSVRAALQGQFGGGGGGGRGGPNGGNGGRGRRNGEAGAATESRGDVELDPQQGGQGGQGGFQRGPQIEVTDAQCAAVKAAFTKKPDAQKQLDALRDKTRSGEIDFQQMREQSSKIYADLGLDARVAGACRMKERQAAGGGPGGGRFGGDSAGRGQRRGDRAAATGGRQGGAASTAQGQYPPVQAGEFPPSQRQRTRPGLVFVAAGGTYQPRVIRVGVSNLDYTEVVDGLKEGEQVALLAAAAMQQRRNEQNDRMRSMTGGGVPGMSRGGGVPTSPGGGGRPGR
jgi:HlyD family secretion protein